MDRRGLVALVEKALAHTRRTLDWLHANRDRWDESVSGHPGVCLLEKIHSEAALFGVLCLRLGQDACGPVIDGVRAMAAQLDAEGTRQRSLGRIMRLPHLSPAFALPIHLREQVGCSLAQDGVLLRRALQHSLVEGIERYPFRQLDVAWIKGRFALPNRRKDPRLLVGTCLAAPVHPIYASLTDLYALTHAFAYDTDFGCEEPSANYSLGSVAGTLQAAASFAVSEGDPDVLAEVLMCAWYMPSPPAWAIPLTDVVTDLWQRFGFLPSADFEVSLLTTAVGAEREAYLLRSSYHPTLVGGLMAVAALQALEQHRNLPEDQSADPALPVDVRKMTLNLLQALPCGRAPLSQRLVDLVGARARRHPVLWVLLADAALIQSCRHYDLDALLDLLEVYASHSEKSASIDDALAFFRGQEVEAGLYGAHFLEASNVDAAGTFREHLNRRLALIESEWDRRVH